MKESFVTPLLLALLFVGVTLGISSVSVNERTQLAGVSGTDTSTTASNPLNSTITNLPVAFSVSVSSDIVCTTANPTRTVGFFTNPPTGGYFAIYGIGATDMGDREPGLYQFSPGTYTWEGKTRTGYMSSGDRTGSFVISDTCVHTPTPPSPASNDTRTATSPVNATTTDSTSLLPSPSPTTTLRPVSVTVSVGAQCVLEKNMTQVAVSVEPRDGATVIFQKENGNVITSATQGLIYLPNGTYTWKVEPRDGYAVLREGEGTFTLAACPVALTPSVLVGGACDPVEEGVPVTFRLEGEGKAYYSLTNVVTQETVPLEGGVEYVPNGSYTWAVVPASGVSAIFNGPTSGNFDISACKTASTALYVPPKAGTILFFRDGKLVDPIVRQGEKIALRVDLLGVSSVELERVGKDSRETLGRMTKDGTSSRWLFVWNVGNPPVGEYNIIARAKGAKEESVSGSRIVEIIPGSDLSLPVTPLPDVVSPPPVPEEFLPLEAIALPEEPVFDRLMKEDGGEESFSTLPIRGVADLISTADILSAKNTLPDAIHSPADLRVFCASEANDDVCFEFLPETLREEAKSVIDEARKEITRAFDERPLDPIDVDQDGITDFDETHFYGTDPEKADSDGDGRKDQEELLADNNPLESTSKVAQITFENPIFGGEERPELLAVKDVQTVVNKTLDFPGEPPPVMFSGTALPNTIVTVYIYSDPIIVRVKADENGLWSYTLLKELPDGSHKAYVAMTDSAGRVLAKSAPLPFVKEAAAVSVVSGGLPGTTPSAPSLFSGASLYAIIVIIFGVIGFAILAIGVVVRSRRDESVIP